MLFLVLSYLVENGVVFIVLCESMYPRKLAFHYLQDIQKEFEKFDKTLIGKITRPYSFVKFGNSLEPLVCYNDINCLVALGEVLVLVYVSQICEIGGSSPPPQNSFNCEIFVLIIFPCQKIHNLFFRWYNCKL